MRMRIGWLVVILSLVGLTAVQAQEYGKFRALEQRAAQVIQQKNDFVAKVLTSYTIPHERNTQGTVVRISMDGRWLDVITIEIVPVLKEAADKRLQLAAHELLFYTAGGTLDLLSETAIR